MERPTPRGGMWGSSSWGEGRGVCVCVFGERCSVRLGWSLSCTLGKTFWVGQQRACYTEDYLSCLGNVKNTSLYVVGSLIISPNNGFGLWPICCSIKTLFLVIVVAPCIQSLLPLAAWVCVSCKFGQLISTDRGNASSPPAPLHPLYGSTN